MGLFDPPLLCKIYTVCQQIWLIFDTPVPSVRTAYMEAPSIEIYHTIVMVCIPNLIFVDLIIPAGVLFLVTKISIKGHVPFSMQLPGRTGEIFWSRKNSRNSSLSFFPEFPPFPDRRLEQKDSNGPPVAVMMSPLCPWPRVYL